MARKGSPPLTLEEMKQLEFSVKNVLGILGCSMSELERRSKLPSKSLTSGFKSGNGRRFTQSHFEILLNYIMELNDSIIIDAFSKVYKEEELVEKIEKKVATPTFIVLNEEIKQPMPPKKLWGELSEQEIDNKKFWIEEIRKMKMNA